MQIFKNGSPYGNSLTLAAFITIVQPSDSLLADVKNACKGDVIKFDLWGMVEVALIK